MFAVRQGERLGHGVNEMSARDLGGAFDGLGSDQRDIGLLIG